jgi:ribosomal protein L11 methyltransferase
MWLQFHLTVDKSQADLAALMFEKLGAVAVTLGDAGDEPMFEPAPGELPLWQATRVTGLFSGDSDVDALRGAFNQALSADVSRNLRLERLDDQDWERAWLDSFRPMRFGKRLWICPGGQAVDQADAIVVDLDPGLAFGTGTHPTTALCLEWLDGESLAGKQVIDFGCGSGILAIAALKLGAAGVVAIDHDPQALVATRDNAARNGVAERIVVHHSSAPPPAAADIVIANILANVLVELNDLLGGRVKPGGRLVMSGILKGQADDVIRAYANRFAFQPRRQREDWVLLDGQR